MVAIKNLVLLALPCVSALLIGRDAATLRKDLPQLDADFKACAKTVNAFDGSSNSALAVSNCENKLDSDAKQSCNDAKNSPQSTFSSSDGQSLINYINNTFEPDVKTFLNALVAKKSTFTSSGYGDPTCPGPWSLKLNFDCVCTAIVASVPTSQTTAAKAACDKVDGDFNTAIASYC